MAREEALTAEEPGAFAERWAAAWNERHGVEA
jgi:hypothetical protein